MKISKKNKKYLLDNFDWASVYYYMKHTNWTWQNQKETPTIEQLKQCVFYLINNVDKKSSYTSTGGFTVQKTEDGIVIEFARIITSLSL